MSTLVFIITDGERFLEGLSRGMKPVFSDIPLTFDFREEAQDFLYNLQAENVHPDIHNFYVESKYN